MKKQKLNHGDIFYLNYNEKYLFGRVLFDVDKQCNQPHIVVEYDNYIRSFGGCQLIEMYKGIYSSIEDFSLDNKEILISRVFCYNIDSRINKLPYCKIGFEKVDYTKVEFPEVLGNLNLEIQLLRGELAFATNFKEDPKEFRVAYGAESPLVIAHAVLVLQNRRDLIEGYQRDEYLVKGDLLYHPVFRNKIYKDIGINPEISYYDLAKQKGFDLARFYI